MAAEIGNGKLTEDIVEDRRRVLDRVVALDHAGRLELGEGEGPPHITSKRHAILQASEMALAKLFIHRPEGRTFLVHVDEDFAETSITEFAGAQITCGRRRSPSGYSPGDGSASFSRARTTFSMTRFDDLLGDGTPGRLPAPCISSSIASSSSSSSISEAVQRLRELGTVAVERICLQCEASRRACRRSCNPRRSPSFGMLIVLEIAPEMKAGRPHHADMAFDREVALADLAQGLAHRRPAGALLSGTVLLRASIAPQTWIWRLRCPFLEKPRCSSRLKSIEASCSSLPSASP